MRLTQVADSLLSSFAIGPAAPAVEPPLVVMQALQLSEDKAAEVLDKVMEEAGALNDMAGQLAA